MIADPKPDRPWPDAMPTLRTRRLVLRPFTAADAPGLHTAVNDPLVVRSTTNIPHPYSLELAHEWIGPLAQAFTDRESLVLAIATPGDDRIRGAIGLILDLHHDRAELGYWIARDSWGQGYASEAARAIVHYGFRTLDLHRIYADHFAGNDASGRVLQKIGMTPEGVRPDHFYRDGRYHDAIGYGVLAADWPL